MLLLLSSVWMAGCGTTTGAASSTPPTIAQFQAANSFDIAKDTLALDSTLDLSGKLTDEQGLKSWSLTILDSAGKAVDTIALSSISGTSVSFDQANTYLSVLDDGSWGSDGTYTVRLTVTNIHGDTTHADLKILAKGTASSSGTQLASQGVLLLGAQGASAGSFLDVTRDSVWKKSGAIPYAHIDIVFGVDGDGAVSLMSPSAAIGDGFDLIDWSTWNSTAIAYSATQLRTASALKAAIDSSGSVSQKVQARNGWYAVKLSTDAYAALKLSSISSSDSTATASVEIFK